MPRWRATILLSLAVVSASLLVVAGPLATATTAATAQAPAPTVPVNECVPGVTVPANVPANGPSPVGRCEPTSKQRAMDTVVWLFLVGLLLFLAGIGVRAVVRAFRPGMSNLAADD